MKQNKLICLSILLSCLTISCSQKSVVTEGDWNLSFDSNQKGVKIEKGNELLFEKTYATYKLGDRIVNSKDYTNTETKVISLNDGFGKGSQLQITYTHDSLPTLVQSFYVYPELSYILTDFSLTGKTDSVSSNYMAPFVADKIGSILPEGENRALFIPYDNDCWIRFASNPLTFDSQRSYEVTAIYNNESRKGLVIGSIEHDNWKTAIDLTKGTSSNIGSITCFGGVADSLTRDSKVHGALAAKTIKSPKVLIGIFSDWRNGMEQYGKANAIVTPKREWTKAMPVGWNSWGALQFKLNYQNAIEVSDFIKNNLQNNHFINADNTVVTGLDSGWNSFTEEQLKSFVEKCKANGQVAGIYWTPFTDWGKNPDREVNDAKSYKYKEVYLYANGKPQELDGAYAIDPTHPAIEEAMKNISELFRRCGFEYVKMDFMTHGAMEADKWFHPEIQTGTQAYNYGMQLLNKYFGDMYLNLSISPIFPANYAQSRRIACDAWNKIKDTEYTMNAVSYGWWIDNVYQFNDADHIVLRDATEGENRARVTSSAITGLFISGDDYSKTMTPDVKERTLKYLTNADVNTIATGRTFRPVEGNGIKSETQFTHTDSKGNIYYVVFNYDEKDNIIEIPFGRLGLDSSTQYTAKELWSGDKVNLKEKITVPAKDVKLIKIIK